ncbi:MAG: transglycosylase domain-containing protein [Deltaproteobacteria bacterium]|nr:transglycosylase domain-containing protein [Deltaproteobacteria bacterium]
MIRRILKIMILLLLVSALCLAAFFGMFYRMVSEEAESRIKRGIIDSIIFSESPVYYDDGQSVIGVFFEKTHRKYIRYKDIPQVFVKAIVAAEDQDFFTHYGFDLKAILRAYIANIKAGRIAQGGSTITQQTAKNIFKREKRSYLAKTKELIQALLLEKEYSKEEILEMYVNQFFVTGFGRGLRIAAKYFFDKEAESLDLVESAFIAGSVKSPNRYNPFIKKSPTERKEAMRLAKLRKNYVLGNMLAMSFITRPEYEDALKKDVPFKEGRVTYRLNVILDYVRDQIDSDYFKAILQEQGVDNIATSGLRIHTSVNKEIQEGALRSLRRHLPLLDVKLTGYGGEPPMEKYRDLVGDPMKRQEGEEIPFFGRITEIRNGKVNPCVFVSWDGGEGVIDYEGLVPVGQAWRKGKAGAWAEFDKRHLPEFLRAFQVGDLVAIEFTGSASAEGKAKLILTKIPALDGGVIVLRKGMIKGMVGGFFDRFFNRAVDGKRQLGSIFKPIVYAAALELKWNTLDPLRNIKDVFPFEATFYIPRPDHEPEADRVSMMWAGVKSENLATVWLLYHLTDQLNMNEFRQVVDGLGLGRKATETYEEYASRIRDKYGVLVDGEDIREAAFEEAKKEMEADLIFGDAEEALGNLSRLHYKVDPGNLMVEGEVDAQLLRWGFLRLQSLNRTMKYRLETLKQVADQFAEGGNTALAGLLAKDLSNFYVAPGSGTPSKVAYIEARHLIGNPHFRPLASLWGIEDLMALQAEDVWIDGLISSKVLDGLERNANRIFERLKAYRKYDAELLYRLSDFKRVVNLIYVIRLAERIGISAKLDPVLSFPLGANSISILEAALAYQSLMTGMKYPLDGMNSTDMIPIITKIEDRQGNLIWEHKPHPERVLSERVSGMICDMLRMVMVRGTGRSAKDSVQLVMEIENEKLNIPVPSFGKTGTANKFTNSSFVGFVPGPNEKTGILEMADGYVIATYVGYDDNRPMKGKLIVVYGSSGALPLWVDTGNAIVNSRAYKKNLQAADLAFDLHSTPRYGYADLQSIPVSPTSGLPVSMQGQEVPGGYPRVFADGDIQGGHVVLRRELEKMRGGPYGNVDMRAN